MNDAPIADQSVAIRQVNLLNAPIRKKWQWFFFAWFIFRKYIYFFAILSSEPPLLCRSGNVAFPTVFLSPLYMIFFRLKRRQQAEWIDGLGQSLPLRATRAAAGRLWPRAQTKAEN